MTIRNHIRRMLAPTHLLVASLVVGLLGATSCSRSENRSSSAVTGDRISTIESAGPHAMLSTGGVGGSDYQASNPTGEPKAPEAAEAPRANPELEAAYSTAIARLKVAANLDAAYSAAESIEEIGSPAAPKLLADLKLLKGHQRLAAGRALHGIGRPTEAITDFAAIAASEDESRENRMAAAELISQLAWEMHKAIVSAAMEKTFDTPVKIELAVALWNTARSTKAKTELNALLKSDSANFRQQAALGLGRLSVPDLTNCRDILLALADEPTDRGRIAQQILLKERLGKQLDLALQRASKDTTDADLIPVDTAILDRVRTMVRQRYIYPDKLGTRRLAIASAAGVLKHLDHYSLYLDQNLARRAAAIRQFEIPTLGIALGATKFRAGSNIQLPTIISVAEGSPADRAGLAPGDQILNVAPHATLSRILEWRSGAPSEWNETLKDFLELKLGGVVDAMLPKDAVTEDAKPQPLALLIRRDGWYLTRWVPLAHEAPKLPPFASQLLPGDLGYMRLQKLDADSPAAFKAALTAYHTKKAKGLLLDLRNSSGGSPDAAFQIAGMLLAEGTEICTVKGRDESLIKTQVIKAASDINDPEIPVTILVNGGTSDAAEILASALKEHGRAKLVGSATFGRAIVQEIISIEADVPQDDVGDGDDAKPNREKHALLLTVGYYYTPISKRRISEGGIQPDIAAKLTGFEGWVYDQLDELNGEGKIRSYVNNLVTKHTEAAIKIAENDGGKTDGYPEWASFRSGSKKNLTDEHLRFAVRRELRTRLMAEGKLPGFADLESDTEFVAGIRSLASQAGLDLSTVKEYATLSVK